MVTARRHLRWALGAVALCLGLLGPGAGAASADTGNPLVYYGGPVLHSATGIVVDWGSQINPIYTSTTTGDPGLIASFAAGSGSTTDTGAVLAQYMDTSGHNSANAVSYGGQYTITPTTSATTLQDGQIGAQLVAQIESHALPTPAGDGLGTVYLVDFPAGTTICSSEGCSGQALCAYHSSALLPDGTHVVYAVLPDNTTGAMTEGCGAEASPIRDQTSYASHEWSESINDPLVNLVTSDGPPLAWYDGICPTQGSACGEIGDKCNQDTTVQSGFTVQLEWSNLDGACAAGESRFAAPAVSLTAPASGAAAQSLSFTGAATDPSQDTTSATYNGATYTVHPGIVGYRWAWGDGTTTNGPASASHTFAAPGVYTVTVTAVDAMGFAGSASQTVAVWSALGAPSAVTGAASAVHAATATLDGTVNPVGQLVGSRFDYGLASGSLASSTPTTAVASGTTGQAVSAALSGLAPATRYYYRLDVVLGTVTLPGAVQSFTTAALPVAVPRPTVATGGAAAVTPTTVQLRATVDPAGTPAVYRFAYGPGRLMRTSTPHAVAGSSARQVAATLRGLHPRTTYRYRVTVTLNGRTITGALRSFRTTARGATIARRALARSRALTAGSGAEAALVGDRSVSGALRHGVSVRVLCPRGCRARVIVTLRLASAASPRALAGTTVELSAGGARIVRLRLAASDVAWLARLRGASLTALAVG